MTSASNSPSFAEYYTVGQAAEFLGVSKATLRNWDRNGKLRPRRHPQNGYRIYLHTDLQTVLESADMSADEKAPLAPFINWAELNDHEHFVQFYETDEYLIESVFGFVHAALTTNHSSVVVATLEHRLELQRRLAAAGIDIAAAIESGRYTMLDAADTLAKILVDGLPDPQRFVELMNPMLSQLAAGGKRVHAFGEMVALLWADGNRAGALRLEEMWDGLRRQIHFTLLCAYPIEHFASADDGRPFHEVCDRHSRVVPAESYAALADVDQRLRAITQLQQKAQALHAEIAHRREAAHSDPAPLHMHTPSRLRILVVDDNFDAGHTMGMLLRIKGHDVRTANDGFEALDIVGQFQPNVVLMDIGMPRLDGYETTRRIRQLPGGTQPLIVALTGWGQSSDRERSTAAGCSAHLVKPVDIVELEKLLAEAPALA